MPLAPVSHKTLSHTGIIAIKSYDNGTVQNQTVVRPSGKAYEPVLDALPRRDTLARGEATVAFSCAGASLDPSSSQDSTDAEMAIANHYSDRAVRSTAPSPESDVDVEMHSAGSARDRAEGHCDRLCETDTLGNTEQTFKLNPPRGSEPDKTFVALTLKSYRATRQLEVAGNHVENTRAADKSLRSRECPLEHHANGSANVNTLRPFDPEVIRRNTKYLYAALEAREAAAAAASGRVSGRAPPRGPPAGHARSVETEGPIDLCATREGADTAGVAEKRHVKKHVHWAASIDESVSVHF